MFSIFWDYTELTLSVTSVSYGYILHIESHWPESLQSTVWTPQSSREQLHSWILQIIGTQVQLSQTRGGGAENWGQSFTAELWQITAIQPSHKINRNMLLFRADVTLNMKLVEWMSVQTVFICTWKMLNHLYNTQQLYT